MLWWLSFADPDRRRGKRFLGVALVSLDSDSITDAVSEAWQLGCNPGGQVVADLLPDEVGARIPGSMIGRLLNADEAHVAKQLIEDRVH